MVILSGPNSQETSERGREILQGQIATEQPPVPQRTWRMPQWLRPELRVKVRHLAGGDTLRHASVLGLAA
jgi:hypothetical protein